MNKYVLGEICPGWKCRLAVWTLTWFSRNNKNIMTPRLPIMAQNTKLSRLRVLVSLWQRSIATDTIHGQRDIVLICVKGRKRSMNLTGSHPRGLMSKTTRIRTMYLENFYVFKYWQVTLTSTGNVLKYVLQLGRSSYPHTVSRLFTLSGFILIVKLPPIPFHNVSLAHQYTEANVWSNNLRNYGQWLPIWDLLSRCQARSVHEQGRSAWPLPWHLTLSYRLECG